MANKKITELTDLPSPAGADILAIVDDVAGTATTKKVTATNLMTLAPVQSVNGSTGAVTVSGTDLFSDIVSETTTARTLSDSDNGKVIVCSNAGQVIVTIPSGLTSGFNCTITQGGAGTVTIAGSGASINGFNDKTATAGQYAVVNVIPVGTNAYYVDGDLTFAPLINTYSVDFDGTNDYANAVSPSSLSNVEAISLWFKPDVVYGPGLLKSYVLGLGGSDRGIALGGAWFGPLSNEVITIANDNHLWSYTASGGSISSGTWHHLGVRWESTSSSTNSGNAGYDIYLDGTKVGNTFGTYTSGIGTKITTAAITTAARNRSGTISQYYNGKIDEFAIFTSAISESDIISMYNSGIPGPLASYSPALWWRMGDIAGGSGTTITDQGSGGNDGTLTNGPTFSTDIPS
jgi:hypothetical protein